MPISQKEKIAGILIPAFALGHKDDLGIGDTTAVQQAIDFCSELGISVLQILPINETGGDNSPYNAISSVALDPMLLTMTPDMVPGLTGDAIAKYATPQILDRLRQGSINYPEVKGLKLQLLAAAFTVFQQKHMDADNDLTGQFHLFEKAQCAWLLEYTLFRTLVNEHAGNVCWTSWNQDLSSFVKAEKWLTQLPAPERERLSHYRKFCSYIQWVAFRQWRQVKNYAESKQVQLIGDIPFGVSRYSADVWAQRKLFDLDWSGGAPPEVFFQTDLFIQRWGQNWGIPLYRWDLHRSENFAWWKQRVRCVGEFFHGFRIDHVLGFFRVYAFPWEPEHNDQFVDLTPEQASVLTGGRLPHFLPAPDEPAELAQANCKQGEEILKVILEAAGTMKVVAEDLGVVPDYVRPLLQKMGIPGFYIPSFERNEEDRSYKDKALVPHLALATYATHDHLPMRSFYEDLVDRWTGPNGHEAWLELQRLMRFLGLDDHHPPRSWTPHLHHVLIKTLLELPCWLSVLMITDLLGTTQRFNQPGSNVESNWSQRLDRPITSYNLDPIFAKPIKDFAQLIRSTNRCSTKA